MNITNIQIWKLIIQIALDSAQKEGFSIFHNSILIKIEKYIRKFHSPNSDVFRSKFIFNENHIDELISKSEIAKLMRNLSQKKIEKHSC